MPGLVRFSLSPALLLRLQRAYPAVVVGLKDSSGDWDVTRTYISALKHTGFKVYCGSETFLLQTLREGGAGCISATANINGPAIAQLASRYSRHASHYRHVVISPQVADCSASGR